DHEADLDTGGDGGDEDVEHPPPPLPPPVPVHQARSRRSSPASAVAATGAVHTASTRPAVTIVIVLAWLRPDSPHPAPNGVRLPRPSFAPMTAGTTAKFSTIARTTPAIWLRTIAPIAA